MKAKTFTQYDIMVILFLVPLTVCFMGFMLFHGMTGNWQFFLYAFLSLAMLFCLTSFYKLTILIDQDTFTYILGVGFLKKSYSMSTIRDCRALERSFLNGIVIKLLSNGWIINFFGMRAIELSFKDSSTLIMLGTDKPEEICKTVKALLPQIKKMS